MERKYNWSGFRVSQGSSSGLSMHIVSLFFPCWRRKGGQRGAGRLNLLYSCTGGQNPLDLRK
jgi:hypothetical protein